MKVLLIQPDKLSISVGQEHLFLEEPLALEYLAADVAPIADVEILDMRLNRGLEQRVSVFKPDIVGVTGFTVHVPVIKAICRELKRINSEIITVVGGVHATVFPQDFACDGIDIIVIGDGVPTLREIVERLDKREDYRNVEGIGFIENGVLKTTPRRPLTNLDDFPMPGRSFVKQYSERYHEEWWQPAASMRTSRGCPNRCKFCVQWRITGGKYLKRSIDPIVAELKEIDAQYVFFVDDESFIDAKRMARLAQEIKTAGINKMYSAFIRADTVVDNPALLEQWKEIGLDTVLMGFEFSSQQELDSMNKGLRPEQNEEALKILKSLDIHPTPAQFLIKPEYDESDFKQLTDYVRGLDVEVAAFPVLTPLPGTQLYDERKDDLLDVGYEYYDLMHTVLPTKLPLEKFYRCITNLYLDTSPILKHLRYYSKYPITKIPKVAWGNYRLITGMRNLHKHYKEPLQPKS
jgi:radical SAM superfamily enzyme YgiQ (UPF0313 family)